jgi:hypothetical protein
MTNIVNFPKITPDIFPSNIDDSYKQIEEVRRNYCDEVSSDVMEAVFSVMSSYGITVTVDEDTVKNIVFMEESIKSLLYKMKKVQHPFQDVASATISLNDDAKEELEKILE